MLSHTIEETDGTLRKRVLARTVSAFHVVARPIPVTANPKVSSLAARRGLSHASMNDTVRPKEVIKRPLMRSRAVMANAHSISSSDDKNRLK